MLQKCPNHSINDLLHGQAYALRNVYYRNFYLADAVAKKAIMLASSKFLYYPNGPFLELLDCS
jgi:hypothetical protein